jgi:hypothetical protein
VKNSWAGRKTVNNQSINVHMYQMMLLKMHGFWAILNVCQEMVPSCQQPPVGGCWAPFSCSWGTEGGLTGPRPGARHTLQHGRPPSTGTLGAPLFPSGRLAGAHKQSVPRGGGKTVLALEDSRAMPVKGAVQPPFDYFAMRLLNGPPQTTKS